MDATWMTLDGLVPLCLSACGISTESTPVLFLKQKKNLAQGHTLTRDDVVIWEERRDWLRGQDVFSYISVINSKIPKREKHALITLVKSHWLWGRINVVYRRGNKLAKISTMTRHEPWGVCQRVAVHLPLRYVRRDNLRSFLVCHVLFTVSQLGG